MKYPDLYIFPEGHPPSPYDQPLSVYRRGVGHLSEGFKLCAVGWIEAAGFPTGAVPEACIAALANAHADKIFSDGFRGVHTCTLCQNADPMIQWQEADLELKGHGHYLVQHGEIVYMAPELLLHYICDHNYCPPPAFIDATATLHGNFLTESDLIYQES